MFLRYSAQFVPIAHVIGAIGTFGFWRHNETITVR